MINKTLLILISIIFLYSGIALARNVEGIPITGIILEQLKMLDRGIEKTRKSVAISNNKEIIQMFNVCCNTRDMISALIKDEKFNKATLDQIIETQKETRNIRKLIEQETFIKKKIEEVEKNLSEKACLISSSNNKKANELLINASKNMFLAEESIKDNNIIFANQYLNASIRLLQTAVSFANGRDKIEDEIEHLQYMLKKAKKIVQISKKEEAISMVDEAKKLVEKTVRMMITYRDEDYEKISEQINLSTKLINRAIRFSGVNISESIRVDIEQLFAILNETNKMIVRGNNPNARIFMDKAVKMAQEAKKAISSKDWKTAEEYINSSYKLTKTASNAIK
ncbi:hypothetical protein KKG56_07630 [bacterium]|nr:hypothetical protein [bacterium]